MFVMFDYIPIMAGIYPLYPHPPSFDHILKPGFYIRYTISIHYIHIYIKIIDYIHYYILII